MLHNHRFERLCLVSALLCMLCGTLAACALGALSGHATDENMRALSYFVYVCFGAAFVSIIVMMLPQYSCCARRQYRMPSWHNVLPPEAVLHRPQTPPARVELCMPCESGPPEPTRAPPLPPT